MPIAPHGTEDKVQIQLLWVTLRSEVDMVPWIMEEQLLREVLEEVTDTAHQLLVRLEREVKETLEILLAQVHLPTEEEEEALAQVVRELLEEVPLPVHGCEM